MPKIKFHLNYYDYFFHPCYYVLCFKIQRKQSIIIKKKTILKQAFTRSLPVMAGYIVLGTGFGILLRNKGYCVLWAFAMSLFIYAGSMQYVGIDLISGGATILTTFLITLELTLLRKKEEETK